MAETRPVSLNDVKWKVDAILHEEGIESPRRERIQAKVTNALDDFAKTIIKVVTSE